jgi:putative tryptophan/tyrosine transport system substrate-binding protein
LIALTKATKNVPIVFVQVNDPVKEGFVASLSKPGGNVTGFSSLDYTVVGKWVEVLREIAPRVTRVAVVQNPRNPAVEGTLQAVRVAASALGVEVVPVAVRNIQEIEQAMNALANNPNGGFIVPPDVLTAVNRELIIRLSIRHRLPGIYAYQYWVKDGGLISYGINTIDLYKRAAVYVDRILRGAKPGDLPVQAPTTFELAINLKTARALGLAVPPILLARADDVIE